MIYITGAGCGDFSFLTLKAKRVIEKADCILYDRLLDENMLYMAKQSCEKIYVGKANHHHSMPQDHINELLVEKGKKYAVVVRLKGGDPYVFGRGSEEALFIKEHGLEFEVLPGITSAIGGCAMAGIPVTHRGIARGVRIMSAHTKDDMFADMDFVSMAKSRDTLVFLMGLSNMDKIVENLLKEGKPADTPIAVVSNAGRNHQHMVCASLTTIKDKDFTRIVSPAVIIVGEVLHLQNALSFLEQKLLFGKRYLLASMHYDEEILWEFQEAGASLDIVTCGYIQELPFVLQRPIQEYTHIVFTSRNGVDAFFHKLFEDGNDVRILANCTLCVIGDKTAQHLKQYGCQADMISDIANSECFGNHLKKHLKSDDIVCLTKAANAHPLLEKDISSICQVESVVVYQTVPKAMDIMEKNYDGLLFTCSFSVKEMMKYISTWDHVFDIPVYAMGRKTSETLHTYGFQHMKELKHAQYREFIHCVKEEEDDVSR